MPVFAYIVVSPTKRQVFQSTADPCLHIVGGRAITKHKEDKRDPPTGVRLERRLEEVSLMLDEVTNVMKDCPPQLRLKEGLDSRVQRCAGYSRAGL